MDAFSSHGDGSCTGVIVDARAVERILGRLVSPDRADRTVSIFSALADATRFRILEALAHEELCVCDLACVCGISQSGISHQLRLLRDRDLVAFRREGTRAIYRLADDHVRVLMSQGLEHAAERARDADASSIRGRR